MRLRRGPGEQPDPAEEAVTSELGWVKVDVDLRQWIPLAFAFPDGYDLDLWATTAATGWLAQWDPVESPDVERLRKMAVSCRREHEVIVLTWLPATARRSANGGNFAGPRQPGRWSFRTGRPGARVSPAPRMRPGLRTDPAPRASSGPR